MNSLLSIAPPAAPPISGCREMAAFASDALAGVREAFQSTEPLPLLQAWRPETEPAFQPGSVRFGWRDDSLLVFAELTGADFSTTATRSNERLWELGDVFEIFVQPGGHTSYIELQIAPNNQRLQLRFPDAHAVGQFRQTGNLQRYVMAGSAFQSRVWVNPADEKWFIYAALPARSVGDAMEAEGRRHGESVWRVSFGRYDFSRGRKDPVISSTSPHALLDFHRQHEWLTLQFKPL